MSTFVVNHTNELPEYDKIFYVLPKAIKSELDGFGPELTIDGMVAVRRLEDTKGDVYVVRSKTRSTLICSVDMSYWFIPKDDYYVLMIFSIRPDGMPVSSDERRLRRLLCSAHDPRSYMDDGEAQSTSGLDFMRASVADLAAGMMRDNHEKFTKQLKQLKDIGIDITTENPFDPVHELDGVIADVEAGKTFDDICLSTIQRVRNYISIVSSYGKKQG